MEFETLFVLDEVEKKLEKLPKLDFYNMCNNHSKTRDFPNNVPMLSVDISSATWDIETEGMDWNELEHLSQEMWRDFEWLQEDIEGNEGIHIFTDLNGYRVLLGSEIYSHLEQIQELQDDINHLQECIEKSKDQEYIRELEKEQLDYAEELEDCSHNLDEEIEKINKFLKLEDRLKEWVKDYPKYWKEYQEEIRNESEE